MGYLAPPSTGIDTMTYLLGIFQTIGVHTLLGLSAYLLLLTGQLSLAQVGFFAIGAYVSGILTVIFSWNIFDFDWDVCKGFILLPLAII